MKADSKHNAFSFHETPDVISGSSESMYTEDELPRDWVNAAAQEMLACAYGETWRTRTSSEIQECIRTTECMLMAIAAHEKEKALSRPAIWMPGVNA